MTAAKTRQISVGGVSVGGGAPIRVQSMLSTPTTDVPASLKQIKQLVDAGCEIVRAAVPSADALDGYQALVEQSPIPVVADIHFDYRLALEAVRRGAPKLRINPGNIGDWDRVDAIIDAAGEAAIPIRIGVNAGSLARDFQARQDLSLAEKLVGSAMEYVGHFNKRNFFDVALSVKASSVPVTIGAYRRLSNLTDCPLHIGVTEAGTAFSGSIKSAVGCGTLLADDIGDTLRVSLTADPTEEVKVAWEILAALDIRRRNPELISCPTCGRTRVDLIPIAQEVEKRLAELTKLQPEKYRHLKIAVMGCEVNGPGEAREVDFGIACGMGSGLVFAAGQPLAQYKEDKLIDALFDSIERC
ncbi:MAG: flavodoxin-dependent (E)-4-hydroxy-3-methylbut-2-enyl-diphosphate synthase [Coriobacteriia bacterium]|nr:flavodoxin-dependent (E)-4-hydroxy-3-methylbut-2-enyl-diphosphate synthase [Coriobacteriia bacterium]